MLQQTRDIPITNTSKKLISSLTISCNIDKPILAWWRISTTLAKFSCKMAAPSTPKTWAWDRSLWLKLMAQDSISRYSEWWRRGAPWKMTVSFLIRPRLEHSLAMKRTITPQDLIPLVGLQKPQCLRILVRGKSCRLNSWSKIKWRTDINFRLAKLEPLIL